MRKRFLLVVAMLLPLAPAPAAAQVNIGCTRPAQLTSPFAFVAVNGLCTDLSRFIVAQTKGWTLNTRADVGGATIDLSAIFNPDPSITFSGTTLNLGSAPATYSFFFGTPIVPDMYTLAMSSVQFTVTSPQGTTTVANSATYPLYISGYGSSGTTLTNLAVDAGTNDCVASGVAATTTCSEDQATSSFAPAFYDNLEALVTYTQDNALSRVTFEGMVSLEQVTVTPEPSTLALLATGLLVVGGITSRRRARRGA